MQMSWNKLGKSEKIHHDAVLNAALKSEINSKRAYYV